MLILPNDDPDKARALFNRLITEDCITMLIIGDGQREDQIASKADWAAHRCPNYWKVIWARNTNFLSQEELIHFRFENDDSQDIVACILNLDDEPILFLTREEADNRRNLVRAFAQAGL